jgi:23S rRNA pseudouridine2605 synthase
MEERLQKLLASAGIASRRASEAYITAGRVSVNGQPVRELGARADPSRDDIRVDGQPLRGAVAHTYILLHKPAGYTSTVSDPHAARTVMELLPPHGARLYPAGRLDRDSEGLLLLTDDGELTQRLLHPRYHLAKEYAVLVHGRITEATLRRLRESAPIEGRQTAPVDVEIGDPPPGFAPAPDTRDGGHAGEAVWLRFVLHEGRKRQIRETCARAGLTVERLVRVRMGPLLLGRLPPGRSRRLSPAEVAALRRACGLDVLPGTRPNARPAAMPEPEPEHGIRHSSAGSAGRGRAGAPPRRQPTRAGATAGRRPAPERSASARRSPGPTPAPARPGSGHSTAGPRRAPRDTRPPASPSPAPSRGFLAQPSGRPPLQAARRPASDRPGAARSRTAVPAVDRSRAAAGSRPKPAGGERGRPPAPGRPSSPFAPQPARFRDNGGAKPRGPARSPSRKLTGGRAPRPGAGRGRSR